MIDVKLPIRTSFYQALSGNLVGPDSALVLVYDSDQKLGDTASLYVLLEQQSGTPNNQNQTTFSSHEDLMISVVQKNPGRVARSQVDFIAAQIVNIILPNPQQNGLPNQPGLQILDVQLAQDAYQDFFLQNNDAVVRRMLTFEMDAWQTNFGGVLPPGPSSGSAQWGMLVFTSNDFSNATDLPVPQFPGQDLVVFFNPTKWLTEGIDYVRTVTGISILISGFNATTGSYSFYITQKAN